MRRWRAWWVERSFSRRGARRLQRFQLEESRQIITEVKMSGRDALRDLSDVVMRLEAVSDQLEESIQGMDDDR